MGQTPQLVEADGRNRVDKNIGLSLFLLWIAIFPGIPNLCASQESDSTAVEAYQNHPPVIDLIGHWGREGDIVIVFVVSDEEGDMVTLHETRFRAQGDSVWHKATVFGSMEAFYANPFGVTGLVFWKTGLDLPGRLGQYDFTMRPWDTEPGAADTLWGVLVDNKNPPPAVSVKAPVGEVSEDVEIAFVIYDRYSAWFSLEMLSYSPDGGNHWYPATVRGKGEGLSSSPEGTEHTLVWESGTDAEGVDSDRCRFRIMLNNGNLAASDLFHVDNNRPPEPPGNLQPEDYAELDADGVLSWDRAPDAEGDSLSVFLRVDDDRDFRSPVIKEDGIPEGDGRTTVRLKNLEQFGNLEENRTYFWKVWATDADPGRASETKVFVLNSIQEPPNPPVDFRMAGFEEGAVRTIRPVFRWTYGGDNDPSDEAEHSRYVIELGAEGAREPLQRCETAIGQTSWEAGALEDNRSYWARIKAVDDEGLSSAWSPDLSFGTRAITMLSPNGGEVYSGVREVLWGTPEEHGGTSTVDLEYSPDGGAHWIEFASGIPNTGRTLWDTAGLKSGTRYLVRIAAWDGTLSMGADQSDGTFVVSRIGLDCQPRIFSPDGDGWHDDTTVIFGLAEAAEVTVRVYNVAGRLERIIADGEPMIPDAQGRGRVRWDGKDRSGHVVPDNIYVVVVRIEEEGRTRTRKQTVVVARD